MGDVIRTVKVKLDVPTERCDDLHQTKDQFLTVRTPPQSGRGDTHTTTRGKPTALAVGGIRQPLTQPTSDSPPTQIGRAHV